MKVYMQAHGVWVAVEWKDEKIAVNGKTDKISWSPVTRVTQKISY